MEKTQALRYCISPLEMMPSEFRKAGYRLIDQVAELLCTLPERPVAPNETQTAIRALLGSHSLPEQGRDAFSYHPPYYNFDEDSTASINYYEYGPQNSRGFRALKVWLTLHQAGREGYAGMISDDIQLAQELYRVV